MIISVMPGRNSTPSAAPVAATLAKAPRQEGSASATVSGVAAEVTPRSDPALQPGRNRAASDRSATAMTDTGTTAAATAMAQGPRERCGDRNFLSMSVCIKRECDRDASLRNHPECVKMREIEDARRNPAN
jgi:hypothetical protein